jgi:glucose-6-phosphate 1-dehydrogenase
MTDPELVAKKLAFIEDVDLGIVRDVVENHLGDLLEFVAAIRRRL